MPLKFSVKWVQNEVVLLNFEEVVEKKSKFHCLLKFSITSEIINSLNILMFLDSF